MSQSNRRTNVSPLLLAAGLVFPAFALIGFAAFQGLDRDLGRSALIAYCAVYCAFVIPLFLAGLASANAPRSPSFCVARDGLRDGARIKPRLCVVESCTLLIVIVSVVLFCVVFFASIPLWAKSIAALPGLVGSVVFFAIGPVVAYPAVWIIYIILCRIALLIFRILHLITAEEAKHFPLSRSWRRDPWGSRRQLDPWPESWQEPQDNGKDDQSERAK